MGGAEVFSALPCLWNCPSLLSSGCQGLLTLRVKWPWCDYPHTSVYCWRLSNDRRPRFLQGAVVTMLCLSVEGLSPDCALMRGLQCFCIANDNTSRSAELGLAISVFVLIFIVDIFIIIILLYLVYMKHEVEKKRALLIKHVPMTTFYCYI